MIGAEMTVQLLFRKWLARWKSRPEHPQTCDLKRSLCRPGCETPAAVEVARDSKDLLQVDRLGRRFWPIQPVTSHFLGAQALEVPVAGRPSKHIQKFEVARCLAESR
jgi:hypothetical protein